MREFRLHPVTKKPSSEFPRMGEFDRSMLVRHPFRTGASRALAAALTAITAGAGAQTTGWSIRQNPNRTFALEGVVAMAPMPLIAEMIEPEVLQSVLDHAFAEAGITLREDTRADSAGFNLIGWDEAHHAGVAVLDARSFSSSEEYALFLQQTLDYRIYLPDDPRDHETPCNSVLDQERTNHLNTMLQLAEEGMTTATSTDGDRVLFLAPNELMVEANPVGTQSNPQQRLAARTAALQRLESQVREFVEYLQTQGL